MKPLKIISAIVCEDVRIEKNGKHVIICVYSNDIVIERTPALIILMLWLQIENISESKETFELRANFGNKEIINGSFSVCVSAGTRATVRLGKFPVMIDHDGDLSFDIRYEENGRWKNANTTPVRISTSSTA